LHCNEFLRLTVAKTAEPFDEPECAIFTGGWVGKRDLALLWVEIGLKRVIWCGVREISLQKVDKFWGEKFACLG
jgi:hypothetical protein